MPPETGTQRVLGQHDAKIEMLCDDVKSIGHKIDKLDKKMDDLKTCKDEANGAFAAAYVICGAISIVVGLVVKVVL